ncbi:hypothetical protein GCM10009548_70640 [Streptomyces malaysiensis subsp. malaysiensis]
MDRIGPVFTSGYTDMARPTGRVLTLVELLRSRAAPGRWPSPPTRSASKGAPRAGMWTS